jgi:hypothetical protein
MVDWAQRKNKAKEEQEAFAAFPKYFSSGSRPDATTASLARGEGGATPTPNVGGQGPSTGGINLDAAMNDPAVQRSPEAMSFIARIKATQAMREPKQQLVPNAQGGMSVVNIPVEGQPSAQEVPGVSVPQKFGQEVEDALFASFGKGPYNPQQVQQAQGSILQKTTDKENRQLERSMLLQSSANEKYLSRLEESSKRAEDRQLMNAGRVDFGRLNSAYNTQINGINKEYQKARAGLYVGGMPMLPPEKLQAELRRLQSAKEESEMGVHNDYLTKWDDLKATYPFYQNFKGGTPGSVQSIIDKKDALGSADGAIMKSLAPKDASAYQQILQSGDQEKINTARQRALKAMRR